MKQIFLVLLILSTILTLYLAYRMYKSGTCSAEGFEDGTEVTEAVTCIVGLSRRQSTVECFSIDRDQLDVVNHKDGRRTIEKRNMFVESARIAKGNLKHVKDLNAKDFDVINNK